MSAQRGREIGQRRQGFPGRRSFDLLLCKRRQHSQKVNRDPLRSLDCHFLRQNIAARTFAIGFALAGLLLMLAIALVMVVMTAFRRLRHRSGEDVLTRVRMVPAASKNRVDEQQGSRQVSDKCLHGRQNKHPRILALIGPQVNPACENLRIIRTTYGSQRPWHQTCNRTVRTSKSLPNNCAHGVRFAALRRNLLQ